MGPKNGGFGESGVQTLDIGFPTQKGTSLRVFFSRTQKVAESLCAEGREITHAHDRNP